MQSSTILCYQCYAELVVKQKPDFPPVSNEWLHSASMLSDIEVAQTSLLMQDVQREIDRYDEEIDRLSITLEKLKVTRDSLQNHKDRYSLVCAPVRKLPLEILTEIFERCCEDGGLLIYRFGDEGAVATPALSLSQTCSYWREVLLSQPKLWSKLYINLIMGDRTRIKSLVDLYLTRSEGGPGLNLDISARTRGGNLLVTLGFAAWSIFISLLEASGRWLEASFYIRWDLYLAMKVDSLGLDCDNLQSLSLKWQSDYHPTITPPFFRALVDTPSLRSLTLQSFCPDFPFAYQNLQKFESRFFVLSDLSSFLAAYPEIEDMVVDIDHDPDPDLEETPDSGDLGVPRVIFGNIRSLRYHTVHPEFIYKVIPNFTFPALTMLDLHCFWATEWQHAMTESLKTMLQSLGRQLNTLKLRGRLVENDQELINVLSLAPAVRAFTLDPWRCYQNILTDKFFRDLSFAPLQPDTSSDSVAKDIILPQLETIGDFPFRIRRRFSWTFQQKSCATKCQGDHFYD
ncbi:hypothetical protein VKT23_001387 [Stygiomarasmius scandens]|uniref:F-box domain-containing protein n=1 Tax=Marasmiellus scandens TaxID=2682957 RepID=A0ABR1K6Y0_9AGAR